MLATFCLHAQNLVYPLQHFSVKYNGKVTILQYELYDENSLSASEGWISIFETATGKEIIREKFGSEAIEEDGEYTEMAHVYMEIVEGKVTVNVETGGTQSILIYKDFNFDGNKDLSFLKNISGTYGWHEYKIYLCNSTGGFSYSEVFTSTQNSYLGMLDVDYSTNRLVGFVKSGCCFHQQDEFIVENNKPKLVKRTSYQSYSDLFYNEITQTLVGNKIQKKNTLKLAEDTELAETCFSFKINENGKQVLLIILNETLYYILQKKNGDIEFYYPGFVVFENSTDDTWEDVEIYPESNSSNNQPFTLQTSASAKSLTFSNSSATYKIYETNDERGLAYVGIEVYTGGKKYNIAGNAATLKGSLSKLKRMNLENVLIK